MADCPMERRFEAICNAAAIVFERDDAGSSLDFYLPTLGVYVEVKQYHSDRISEQMARRPDVIAIQGRGAMEAFAAMVLRTPTPTLGGAPRLSYAT